MAIDPVGKYVLNERGEPVPELNLKKWGQWYETAERHVADDQVGDVRVSTVFLGLDHSFGRGRPVLYETLVFGGPLNGDQDRYATRAEALAGHQAMLDRVKASDG